MPPGFQVPPNLRIHPLRRVTHSPPGASTKKERSTWRALCRRRQTIAATTSRCLVVIRVRDRRCQASQDPLVAVLRMRLQDRAKQGSIRPALGDCHDMQRCCVPLSIACQAGVPFTDANFHFGRGLAARRAITIRIFNQIVKALRVAFSAAGKSSPTRTPMIAISTRSSINVNPRRCA